MKSEAKPYWTMDEFRIYLLLYAAHADFAETEEERDRILARCDSQAYKRIHREFDQDNDYQHIEKIIVHLKAFKLSKVHIKTLLSEMNDVQTADRKADLLEKSMMMLLKRIFEQETTA
jgi:hypothetical protein